jgi:ribosomal protein L7/L12
MPTSKDPLPPQVQSALRAGSAIEAIKLLRDATGLSLKEAKDRIDAEARQGNTTAQATQYPQMPGSLPFEVVRAMQAGNKIDAIRLLREQTGMGLKEAKEAVEASQPLPKYSPGEVPRRFRLSWFIAVAVALLALYFFLRSTPLNV